VARALGADDETTMMNRSIQAKLLMALAVALTILGTLGVLTYRTIRRLVSDNERVVHSNEVLMELDGVLGAVLVAEGAVQHMLVAAPESVPDRQISQRKAIEERLTELERQLVDEPDQLARIARLKPLVTARLDLLGDTLDRARSRGFEAARRQAAEGSGQLLTQRLRAASTAIRLEEQRLLRRRVEESRRSSTDALWAFGLLVALFLASLGLAFALVRNELNERRRVAEELRLSRERFELAVRGSTDGIWDWDILTDEVYFSPQWKSLLGYEDHEITGGFSEWESRLHPDDHDRAMATIKGYHEGRLPLYELEHRLRHKDGSYRWILARGVALRDARGVPYRMSGSHSDITERKLAERQLAEQNRLLAEAVRSERDAHRAMKDAQVRLIQTEKLASLGQMVAGVAHEINNPLAFVTNNLAVLQRDVAELTRLLGLYREADDLIAAGRPELERRVRGVAEPLDFGYTLENLPMLLQRSREGLKRISQIVKNLRDFARLDEDDLKEADLNAGIGSTLEILRGHALKRSVQLKLDLQPLPPVLCYPGKINQVVLNLLSNAIDACPCGGEVTVRTRRADAEDAVELHVIDTGHGIPADIQGKIFDPFFTTKPIGQGTGLGLSISYGIVQEHGGRITLESAPGRGAHFTVILPRRPPQKIGSGEFAAIREATQPSSR
jgi:PAS domain S-box-containing protein